jgi:stage V sporulation protein R
MAHVFGHVDFFKNNFCVRVTTNQGVDPRDGQPLRKWIDTMANDGSIVRTVEPSASASRRSKSSSTTCLSLENLIDPQKALRRRHRPAKKVHEDE